MYFKQICLDQGYILNKFSSQVQKEREAEGDEFADKESFVTAAYRKKMEELQKLEEEERKQGWLKDRIYN